MTNLPVCTVWNLPITYFGRGRSRTAEIASRLLSAPIRVRHRPPTTARCAASDLFPMDGSVGYDRQRTMLHSRHCHPIAEIRPSQAVRLTLWSERPHRTQEGVPLGTRQERRLAGRCPSRPGVFHRGTRSRRHRPTTFLLRALDNYLTLPSLLMEDPGLTRRRRYGLLGSFRRKSTAASSTEPSAAG